jgi:homoserine dehydrogenase
VIGVNEMQPPLRIGIAGLGTVGSGVVRLLRTNGERLTAALGRRIELAAVSARTPNKDRDIGLDGVTWIDDVKVLARHPGIDVFVELIGEADGLAKAAVEAALGAGKHVVTANKALLARHGRQLALLAEKNGVTLAFEAAVAGGIPVIKTIREALVGNEIIRVYGILNGTCNYILTKMQEEGRPFAEVLAEAQALGYAEADPTFDVGGHDTAHKLAILTSLAFATEIAFEEIHREGIQSITPADIEAADDLGYRVKLLGVALKTQGGIEARVHPAMVPKHSAIAEVSGVTNAVAIEGDFIGNLLLVGAGAGAKATASAVISDIADIARQQMPVHPFLVPANALKPYARATLGLHQGAYYVRLAVYDRPGAMAAIASRMGEQGISIESIVQRRPRSALPGIGARLAPGELAPVVMITHETTEAAMRRALAAIEADGKVAGKPQMIRIERL